MTDRLSSILIRLGDEWPQDLQGIVHILPEEDHLRVWYVAAPKPEKRTNLHIA